MFRIRSCPRLARWLPLALLVLVCVMGLASVAETVSVEPPIAARNAVVTWHCAVAFSTPQYRETIVAQQAGCLRFEGGQLVYYQGDVTPVQAAEVFWDMLLPQPCGRTTLPFFYRNPLSTEEVLCLDFPNDSSLICESNVPIAPSARALFVALGCGGVS